MIKKFSLYTINMLFVKKNNNFDFLYDVLLNYTNNHQIVIPFNPDKRINK